jgi:hypothetical protein
VEAFLALKEEIFKIQYFDIESQTELVGEKMRIAEQNVDIEPLISM